MKKLPKLLLCGPSRCGKDESGRWLREHTELTFEGTTSLFLAEYVAAKLGVSREQAWNERHENKMFWFHTGNEIRENDPGFFMRRGFENATVTGGIRSNREVAHAQQTRIADLIIWIEKPDVGVDPTLEFGADMCDITIRNDADLPALFNKWYVLCNALGVGVRA